MKNRVRPILFRLFTITLVLIFFSCNQESAEERDLKHQFGRLQKCIQNKNGDLFLKLIDDDTREYFGKILEASREYDQVALAQLKDESETPLIDCFYIYTAREMIGQPELQRIAVEDLIKLILEYGGFNDLLYTQIQAVRSIHKGIGVTTTYHRINEQTSFESTMIFNKDEKKWTVDLTSKLPLSNKLIKLFCRSKKIENQFNDCLMNYSSQVAGIILAPIDYLEQTRDLDSAPHSN